MVALVDSRELRIAMRRAPSEVRKRLAKRTAEGLRGKESLWPVDTGTSKAGWRANDKFAYNVVDYAFWVEQRHRDPRMPASATVQRHEQQWADEVSKELVLS